MIRPFRVAVLVALAAWLGAGELWAVEVVRPDVVASWPHDPEAFTQGLLLHCGAFYESTGLYGESSLRQVDVHSGEVLRAVPLPKEQFGEGLALVDERLIQLTWENQIAHEYARATFASTRDFAYEGEGWGLCYDGTRLVMSDGSSELLFRDPQTFELLGRVTVSIDGEPVDQLNELECVGELVYANVWRTDSILRLDPNSGEVLTQIDASGLLSDEEKRSADVLNGIAYHATSQHFFIGGKLWPRLFEVRFPFQPERADIESERVAAGRDAGSSLVGAADPAQIDPEDCSRALRPEGPPNPPSEAGDAGPIPTSPTDAGVELSAANAGCGCAHLGAADAGFPGGAGWRHAWAFLPGIGIGLSFWRQRRRSEFSSN